MIATQANIELGGGGQGLCIQQRDVSFAISHDTTIACTCEFSSVTCLEFHPSRATPTRINGHKDTLPMVATIRPFMRALLVDIAVYMRPSLVPVDFVRS